MTEHMCMPVHVHVRVRLVTDPTDCSPPGFTAHGILQARILG